MGCLFDLIVVLTVLYHQFRMISMVKCFLNDCNIAKGVWEEQMQNLCIDLSIKVERFLKEQEELLKLELETQEKKPNTEYKVTFIL